MNANEPVTPGVHPFRLAAADGVALVGDSHLPAAGELRRRVVLVHGFAEHRGRYAETIAALVAAGCAVHAFDLRGHGDSGGRRGHVDGFADYRRDLARVVAERAGFGVPGDAPADLPLILFGHSLGGLIALDQVLHAAPLDAAPPFAALVLSGPFLAPAFRVAPWKRTLAEVASHLPPWFGFPAGVDAAGLSHDAGVVRAYRDDPKVFDDVTADWFVAVSEAQREVLARASEVRLPVLMLVGGADPVADPAVSRRFFESLGSDEKCLRLYAGLLHEVLNERERRRVLADLLAWLTALPGPPAAPASLRPAG